LKSAIEPGVIDETLIANVYSGGLPLSHRTVAVCPSFSVVPGWVSAGALAAGVVLATGAAVAELALVAGVLCGEPPDDRWLLEPQALSAPAASAAASMADAAVVPLGTVSSSPVWGIGL
jgi:hypothetical protein